MSGAELKKYVERNGIVKSRLADKMGLPRQALNQIFRTANISTNTLEQIAEALNTLPEKIYEEIRCK